MDQEFEITLEENALDFLISGIEYYIKYKEPRDLKHAIINIMQAVELFLKARLAKEHWMLIYTKPENCLEDSQTVYFNELIKRLTNVGIKFDEDTINEINDLRKYRNRLIHGKIKANEEEVTLKIGKGVRFLEEFLDSELNFVLKDELDDEIYDKLNELIRSYKERVEQAKEEMERYLPGDKDKLNYQILMCPECDEETICYPDNTMENSDDVHCFFCKSIHEVWVCPRCGEIQFHRPDSSVCDICWDDILRD